MLLFSRSQISRYGGFMFYLQSIRARAGGQEEGPKEVEEGWR
jgi:hypothetical protein